MGYKHRECRRNLPPTQDCVAALDNLQKRTPKSLQDREPLFNLMIEILRNLFKPYRDEKLEASKTEAWASGKPLGRLPQWVSQGDARSSTLFHNVTRANRYLSYQEARLQKLRKEKQYKKLVIIWLIMLKNSKVYQLSLFNRVNKGWYYKFNSSDAIKLLRESMSKCRKWDMTLTLQRFYLDKGMEKTGIPNGKFRPIGSPTRQSRVISKSLNDLIYFLFEDRMRNFQHGFRRDRGTWSALYEVWHRIAVLHQRYIYEFDFQSYFNKVRIEWVYTYLKIRSEDLANLIIRIIGAVEYKFDRTIDKLPEEAEVRVMGKSRWQQVKVIKKRGWKHIILKDELKHLIVRSGLPQGLSISPILATLMIEIIKPPKGLVMYADDGLFITNEESEVYKIWLRQIKTFGITLEPSKSGLTKGVFKFLGVEFDLFNETVKYNESLFTWKDKDTSKTEVQNEISNWFRKVSQYYGKKPEGWTWEIEERSFATEFRDELSLWRRIMTMIIGIWKAGMYKGYRYFLGSGCYQISSLSTKCCGLALEHLKDIRLARIRELSFIDSYENKFYRKNKTKYWEENQWILKLNIHKILYLNRMENSKKKS